MPRTSIKELWETIEFLNCKLEEANKKPLMTLDMELIELIRVGQYIGAIKLYRERTKSSLLDSKNYAEALRIKVLRGEYGEFNREHYRYLLDNPTYQQVYLKKTA